MTTSRVLSAVKSTRWRRFAIALFGVSAILLGFFAMHALSSESASVPDAHPAVEVLATSIVSPADAFGDGASQHQVCGQECGITHDVLSTICTFLLIMTALLVLAPMVLRFGLLAPPRQVLRRFVDSLSLVAQPSLILLSISRT